MIIEKGVLIPGAKPFQDRPKGELILISRKGGQAKTQAKSDAQKWRFLKERIARGDASQDDAKWIVEQIENDKAMAFKVLSYLNSIEKELKSPTHKILLAKTMNDVQKSIHVPITKTENVNINIDANALIKEAYRRRMEREKNDDTKNE